MLKNKLATAFLVVLLLVSLSFAHFKFDLVPEVKANPDSDTKQVGQSTDDATVYDTNGDGTVDSISPTHIYPKIGLYSGGYYGQSFRTTGWSIPSGSTIVHAYVYMTSRSTLTGGSIDLEIKGEEADGATFSDLTDYLARTRTTASASWNMGGDSWVNGVERCSSDYSCDLKDVIQEVLDDSSVETLTDIVLFVEDMDADSTGQSYYVHSYDSSSGDAPRLYVSWVTPDSDSIQVSQSTDDATVYDNNGDGTVDIISPTDIYPKIGLYSTAYYGQPFRTTGWNIPSAATITHAYVYMTSRTTFTASMNLEIKGQEANGATFGILIDYLNRPRTDAVVGWDETGEWASGVEKQSPDIASVIQEILDTIETTLTDIVLFIEDMDSDSTDSYYVHSYDSSSGDAPRLYVSWTTLPDTTPPTPSLTGKNTTRAGAVCNFYTKWLDETGLATSGGYIFGTNNTGSWHNETWLAFSANPDWSSKTKTLNSTVGVRVEWCIWANDTSDNWNNITIQYFITELDFSSSLIYKLDSLINNVDWNESIDTMYIGFSMGQTGLSDLESAFASLDTAISVLKWSVILKKFGIENETKVKWALDNQVMMSNGLPDYDGNDRFSVSHRYLLLGYHWAEEYSYQTDKWNKTKAYENFKWAIDHSTYPAVLYVYSDNTTYCTASGPRFYDEAGQTIDCFLKFYELGITEAMDDAVNTWEWINNELWTGTHYDYARLQGSWECESGGFLQIITKLEDLNPTVGNITRLKTDLVNRYIAKKWGSPQWTWGDGTEKYVVVHHNPDNPKQRLQNTIMAWSAILGINIEYSEQEKTNVTDMLEGFSGYDPAWDLLFNSSHALYSSEKNLFKLLSGGEVGNRYTAEACALLLNLGMVSKTGTMAIPLEEYFYEYRYNIIDGQLFSINITSRTVKVPIRDVGTADFLFNETVTYNFTETGLYELTFSGNWSSITDSNRISSLPSNRIYLSPPINYTVDLVQPFTIILQTLTQTLFNVIPSQTIGNVWNVLVQTTFNIANSLSNTFVVDVTALRPYFADLSQVFSTSWAVLTKCDFTVALTQSFSNVWNVLMQSVFNVAPNLSFSGGEEGTFGKTEVGGENWTGAEDRVYLCKFTLGEDGDVTKISLYGQLTSASSVNLQCAIYNDSAGEPNARQGVSAEVSVNNTLQWWEFTCDPAISLTAGVYWFGWNQKTDPPVFRYYFDTVSGAARYKTYEYDDGFPATVSGMTNLDKELSIYATYTTTGGGFSFNLLTQWNIIESLTQALTTTWHVLPKTDFSLTLTQSFATTWTVLLQTSFNIATSLSNSFSWLVDTFYAVGAQVYTIDLTQSLSAVWNVLIQSAFNTGSTVTMSVTEKTEWETDSFNDESKIAGKWQVYVDTGNGWVRLEDYGN